MGERLSWDDRLNAVTVKELRQSLCGSRKTLFSGLMVMVLLNLPWAIYPDTPQER